jgi:hypothetical protein
MNTKILMTFSSILMILTGVAFTFIPQEITQALSMGSHGHLSLILQILGALYFSFGMLNWMAKGNIIGGIYSRPIAIGNAAHFFIGSMALLKYASQSGGVGIWTAGITYLVLAILFGKVLYTHPAKQAV